MANIGEYIDSVTVNTVKLRTLLGGRLGESVEPGIGVGGMLKGLDDSLYSLLDDIEFGHGKAIGCSGCEAVFETVEGAEEHERETGHGEIAKNTSEYSEIRAAHRDECCGH